MSRTTHSKKSGFTMVELAVTMSIFAVLTSVVLANYRTFSNNADFLNVADNIALSLREAQIYGVGSKGAVGVTCGSPASAFDCAYGVSFKENDAFYTIFVDAGAIPNKIYDSTGSPTETIEKVFLPSGTKISGLSCTTTTGGTDACTNGLLDVTFKRPDPDAIIIPNGVSTNPPQNSASIIVKNTTKEFIITISRAGQISITTREI
jgi:prepilin-type N-terminal cleavage/methylation domain-containing protein